MTEPSDEPSATTVHTQLTIGNFAAATQLSMDEYDTVVTTCQDSVSDHIGSGVDYHYFNMSDGETTEWGGECHYDIFAEAADTILSALQRGDDVFVHCHHGRSRSVSTATAALATHEGTSFGVMYNRIKEHRPQVNPNETLVEYGMRYVARQYD